jgi:hypothetical protein
MRTVWRALTNSVLAAILLLILTLPASVSLFVVLPKSEVKEEVAFEINPSVVDYGEFLSYGKVAGGQAEALTLTYTAFPGFAAYYDAVYVIENTQKVVQRFEIELLEERRDVRLFFAGVGEEDGPTELALEPGEKAAVTLAAEPIQTESSQTGAVSFVIQSLPQ